MTRQDYLNELKWQLKSLPVEEQEEALEYYRQYFEDAYSNEAGSDSQQTSDEKVMAELGTPQELAQSIISKFAGVPATRAKQENHTNDGTCGTFSDDEVRSMDISLGVAEIVMITGDHFSVDYRGIAPGDIRYGLSPFGTFTIENTHSVPCFGIWTHNDSNEANHPRILIRIPANTKLDLLRLHIGAGSFAAKEVDITCARSYIDVGAGNIILNKMVSDATEFKCGMGNITYTGELHNLVKADCGMGNIALTLKGNPDEYSVDAKVGLGTVKFNDKSKSGIGTFNCNGKEVNHFSINCGMGNVAIKIN